MYEKVLVPFDFSPNSQYAVACLKNIPAVREVILLHVIYTKTPSVPGDFISPESDYARLRLGEYVRGLGKTNFSIRTQVEEITGGNISDVVNRVAAAERTSLTVLGRRGQGVIETLLIGSVANDILRYGTTDLLLAPLGSSQDAGTNKQPCSDLFSHVLICTDFSLPDVTSLALERIPRPRRISLLHVVSHGESKEEVEELSRSAWLELEREKNEISSPPAVINTAVRVGSPSLEIVGYAATEGVSLIILKSAGVRGFIPRFLGSTAAQVARTARVPLLVIKQGGTAPK